MVPAGEHRGAAAGAGELETEMAFQGHKLLPTVRCSRLLALQGGTVTPAGQPPSSFL